MRRGSDVVFPRFAVSRFLGQGAPNCDDGNIDISDVIATLGVLFLGNGVIPLPSMTECSVDPRDDFLELLKESRLERDLED